MRIRSIKPEFWRSDDIDALCLADRLLFIGLWSYVDDAGIGVDKESAIAADLFAADLQRDHHECSVRIHGGLKRLAQAGLITRYTVDGKRYLHVTNWNEHQKINKPTESKHPGPASENAVPTGEVTEDSGSPPEMPLPGAGEQGNRGVKEAPTAVAPPPSDPEPENKITAGTIVAGWAEAFEESTGRKPSGSMRGQVGREAKACLETADASLVLKAATQVAGKGFATLERELAPMLAKAKATPVIPDGWPEGWGAPSVPGGTSSVPFWER